MIADPLKYLLQASTEALFHPSKGGGNFFLKSFRNSLAMGVPLWYNDETETKLKPKGEAMATCSNCGSSGAYRKSGMGLLCDDCAGPRSTKPPELKPSDYTTCERCGEKWYVMHTCPKGGGGCGSREENESGNQKTNK